MRPITKTSDQELLEGIIEADPVRIKQVYDLALPSVIHWVKENNGTEADARDVYQEALIALFRKLEAGDFTLSCTLKSFLRIMCRNLWLAKVRNQKKFTATPLEDIEAINLDAGVVKRLEQSEKEQLYFKHFDQLDENCRKILQWFFDKVSLKEIALKLDTSEGYIKKRKYMCKEKLMKTIQNDPAFEELKSE